MTRNEKLTYAWHVFIQWLASRDELEMWIDDVLKSEEDGWVPGGEFDPLYGSINTENFDFFGWTPSCPRTYDHWHGDWREIGYKLGELLDENTKASVI